MAFFNSPDSGASDSADAVTRLQEVLRGICATEHGQEKTWLNVQPCVLHAVRLLAATAQAHAARVRQLEDSLQQLQQYTTVLVQDRDVKEERYRLDTTAHREEADRLWESLFRLEAQQQIPSRQLDERTSEAVKAMCKAAVEARVVPLQQELQRLRHRLKAVGLSCPHFHHHHQHHACSSSVTSNTSTLTLKDRAYTGGDGAAASECRHRSATSSSSSSSSSPLTSSTASSLGQHEQSCRRGRVATTGAPAPTSHALPSATAAGSAGTPKMMREVQRLRRQWQHFLRSVPAALAEGTNPFDGGAEGDHRRAASRGQSRLISKGSCRDSAGRLFSNVKRTSRVDMASTRGNLLQPFHLAVRHPSPSAPRGTMLPACSSGPTRAPSGASAAAFSSALPASGRRVRWYWLGDAQSHFSTAVRRAENGFAAMKLSNAGPQPMLNRVSPALPWTECHAFDGRTDCWYSLGTWAAHQRNLREMEQAGEEGTSGHNGEVRLGWMTWTLSLASWPDMSTMLVERAGIYAVRVCLVRHCASASLCSGAGRAEADSGDGGCGGALTLWMNGVSVAGMREVVTHTLLYAHPAASTAETAAPWWTTRGKSHSIGTSAGNYCSPSGRGAHLHTSASPGGSPTRRRVHGDIAGVTQRQRTCCEPAQLHTNTLSACLFLPAGAALQVRCRGLHDTKTVHEAFCELEYVV
ncbi:hypothetical protein NXY56_006495 [Leishmania guyanensis]